MRINGLLILELLFAWLYSFQMILGGNVEEAAENSRWKEAKMLHNQKMVEKENTPLKLSKEQSDKLAYSVKLKNHFIGKIMEKGKVSAEQSQNPKYTSFLSLRRTWESEDNPKNFFKDTAYTANINQLPTAGSTSTVSWSGYWWPTRNGEASVRYTKNLYDTIGEWSDAAGGYISTYPWSVSVGMYAQPSDYDSIKSSSNATEYIYDIYSPSEKYDLLVGDYNFTFTNALKNKGAQYAYGGDLPDWFGICDGWTMASFLNDRPLQSVVVSNADGLQLTFFPDDIKALASEYWANAHYTSRFLGGRCPYVYPQPGWFTDPTCISLNPGTFYITLGNWVGLYGKHVTFDPNADGAIWNLPVKDYAFRFYNPLTNDFSADAASSKVSKSQLLSSGDNFNTYVAQNAAPTAVNFVGVFMNITHVNYIFADELVHGNNPHDNNYHSYEFDAIIGLDANDNIVGGEWVHKTHPNFMWVIDQNKPVTDCSNGQFPNFVFTTNLPELSQKCSNEMQPLKAIVDFLTTNSA